MKFGEIVKNWKTLALAIIAFGLVSCSKEEKLSNLVQFQKVVPVKNISLKINNYCWGRTINRNINAVNEVYKFDFLDIYVRNLSTVVDYEKLWIDIDRDGLNPILDNNTDYNLDIDSADTNGDGYGDLTMLRAGIISAEQADLAARPCADPNQDTDNDLISDCDENLLTLDKFNPDTDGDFMPDGLELRAGLSPRLDLDANVDTDGDGVLNILEVKQGTPPLESNNNQIKTYAYNYRSQTNIAAGSTSECDQFVDFTIENIPVVQTFRQIQVSPGVYRYGNVVVLMFTEMLTSSTNTDEWVDPSDVSQGINQRMEIRKCEIIVPDNEPTGYVFEGDYVTNSLTQGFQFEVSGSEVYCD